MDESTGKANREEARGVAGELDHLFRHESGQLVAALTRTLGLRHLALAEDVVQDTLADALEAWKFQGMPSNPSGWLYRVARNKAIDNLRHDQRLQALADRIGWHQENQLSQASPTESERREDAISLLFALCHPALSQTSQIALLLKTLGGFSIVEISRAFLMPEASVAKRLYRARETLKTQSRCLNGLACRAF